MKMRIGIGLPPKASGAPGSGAVAFVRSLTSESWLSTSPDGRQLGRIATEWKWDDSGTTLRLTLRRDIFFHDGTQLTPEIAAQALRATAADPNEDLSFKSISGVTASGNDAVEIKLKERNSFVLTDLASVLLLKPVPPGGPEIGTGPFQIISQDDAGAKLRAFGRYFRGRPGIGEIDVINYPTQRKAWTSMMRDEIDMLHEVSRESAEFVEAETTVKTYLFPRAYYIPLVFSVRHPILKNPEVRKALTEAIDKEALVKDGMKGHGRPADGPVFPEHWAYAAPAEPFVFDPAAARRRLDAAGVKDHGPAGRGGPGRFSFKCLIYSGDTRFERLAILVQKQLADVGVDMILEPMSTQKELVGRLGKGDFDAFIFEFTGRSLSRAYEWWHSDPAARVDGGYRAADAVLERIRAAQSDNEVRADVAQLARILHDDPPAVFLAWQATARAVSTKFDVQPERDRDIMASLWQWRPAGVPKAARR